MSTQVSSVINKPAWIQSSACVLSVSFDVWLCIEISVVCVCFCIIGCLCIVISVLCVFLYHLSVCSVLCVLLYYLSVCVDKRVNENV